MMRYRSNRELFCLVFIRSLLVVMVVLYWKDSDWHTWPWNSKNCVLSYLWRADRQTAQGRAGDQKDLVLWSVLNSSSDIPLKLFLLHIAQYTLWYLILRRLVILLAKPKQVEFCKSEIYFCVLFMACSKCPQFPLIHKYFLLWCTFPRTSLGPCHPAYYLCQHTFHPHIPCILFFTTK